MSGTQQKDKISKQEQHAIAEIDFDRTSMTVAFQQLPDEDSCFVQISTKNDSGLQVIHSAPSISAVQPPMYKECTVTDNELMEPI